MSNIGQSVCSEYNCMYNYMHNYALQELTPVPSECNAALLRGLLQEIEKLVLSKPTSSAGQEPEEPDLLLRAQDIPDGHRAPIPEITRLSCTRSVDTQTPSAQVEEPRPTSSNSRPESLSPAVTSLPPPGPTTDLLHPDSRSDSVESKSSKGDSEFDSPEPSKFVSSPKPEKSCPFVRQPPDGCEKVKVIEETRNPSSSTFPASVVWMYIIGRLFSGSNPSDDCFLVLIRQMTVSSGSNPSDDCFFRLASIPCQAAKHSQCKFWRHLV
ncbi:hypothetical protein BaRGS_00008028 [Batillaria attramentaria]|uniref:Uncharacterized protein n=1 Tax=Batillaria attramentaria TaxID=370345 RepID=A0ABD0LP28_9CAEN